MDNLIISYNSGGLGNRIRPFVSTLRLGKIMDREPLLCWPINNHCSCSFDDLFDFPITQILPDDISNLKQIYFYEGKYFGFSAPSKICAISNKPHKHIVIKDCYKWVLYEGELGYEKLCTSYEEEWDFLPEKVRNDLSYHLNMLKPKYEILLKLNSFKEKIRWDNNIVGVQIRRKDKQLHNSSTFIKSNDNVFIKELSLLLSKDKETRFFIASDCKETTQKFQACFNKNVIIYDKTNYDLITDNGNIFRPKEAVKEALIELLLLAETKMILGSFDSTFSSISPYFYGRPFKIVM